MTPSDLLLEISGLNLDPQFRTNVLPDGEPVITINAT